MNGLSALSHLVLDEGTSIGACLLLRSGATACVAEADAEREATISALSRSRTMAAAAARLDTHRTLYRRLERYGLHPERSLDSR